MTQPPAILSSVVYRRPAILLYFLLLFSGACQAQLQEWYYSDTLPRTGGNVREERIELPDGIIISGLFFKGPDFRAGVTRLDTNGVIQWQYFFTNASASIQTMIADSGNAVIVSANAGQYLIVTARLSIQTGVPYFETQEMIESVFDLTPYDSTSFLMADRSSSMVTEIRRIHNTTGQVLSVTAIPYNFSVVFDMELEPVSKDVFISCGSQVARVSPTGFTFTPWQMDYYPIHNATDVNKLDYDPQSGQLFMFGERLSIYSAFNAKLNTQTGAVLWWKTSAIFSDVEYADHKFYGNYIITTWKHTTTGAALWQTMKVDTTGVLAWEYTYALTPVWTSSCTPNPTYSAVSLDVDYAGDIYMTGYYCGNGWGPSNWGILKLAGSNGNALYQHTITLDSLEANEAAEGNVINVIGSRVYCIGMIETADMSPNFNSWESSSRYFVKFALDGTMIHRRFFQEFYHDNSTAMQIVPVGTDKYAVLKQIDRTIELDLYGYNRNLLWRKRPDNLRLLLAHSLQVTPDGSLYLNAVSGERHYYNYSMTLDSMLTFRYDTAGNLLGSFAYRPSLSISYEFTPILFANDSDFTYIVMKRNSTGDTYLQKFNATTALPEIQVNLPPVGSYYPKNSLINYSSSQLKLLWQGRILDIDKTTLAITSNIQLGTYKIREVIPIDSGSVLVTGYSGNTMNQWQGLISRVNLMSNTVSWAATTPLASQAVCAATDKVNQLAYVVVSKHISGDSSLYIRKFDLLTGTLLTTGAEYNHDSTRRIVPNGIQYDACRNRLVVAADQNENVGNGTYFQPVFCTFDTSGALISDLIRSGDFAGHNTAACVQVLPDGSVWGGGRLMRNADGKAAFVFELDTALTVLTITAGGPVLFCPGDSVVLTASGSGPYLWNTGDTSASVVALLPGAYQVQSPSGGCAQLFSAPVYVQWHNTPVPVITNVSDTLYSTTGISYQWFYNGNPIVQATGATYIPLQNGSYSVVVGYASGCSDTSAPYIYNGVGIHEQTFRNNLRLRPNPVRDQLLLKMPGNPEASLQLQVISVSGTVCYTEYVSGKKLADGHTLPVETLLPGIYMLRISGDHTIVSARFIVIR